MSGHSLDPRSKPMTTDRTNGSLYTRRDNGVAHVEFGHPASNSFVLELLDRLADTLAQLATDPQIALIVLRSEGDRAFCGGASLEELLALSDLQGGKNFFGGFARVINAMRQCPQPIIGRVQGKAVGGGVGLVAACDYVHASVDAAIRLSELSLGIGPFVIAPALERKMGKAALGELALYPTQWMNAYWAKEKGLYAKVYDSQRELDRELDIHLQQLASYEKSALSAMKKVLWEDTGHWAQLLGERAELSAKLALLPQTKTALEKLKK